MRWPRPSNTMRHRADSVDTRSSVFQRQRRNRKSAANTSTDSIRKSNTSTVPLSSQCFETVKEGVSYSVKSFANDQDFFSSSLEGAAFPSVIAPNSLCDVDMFPTRSVFSDINSSLSVQPSCIDTSGNAGSAVDQLSPFHSKVFPLLVPKYDSPSLVEDDFSSVMCTQLAWNPLEICTADDATEDGRNLPLLSEDSMLTASQLTDSSQDEAVFCDDRELMLAAYSTVLSPSDQQSFRRGSDAPPPSPESNCGEQSSSFEEAVSNLAEMKVETSVVASPSNTQFATDWTSVFQPKSDDLSLSDVDMEH